MPVPARPAQQGAASVIPILAEAMKKGWVGPI